MENYICWVFLAIGYSLVFSTGTSNTTTAHLSRSSISRKAPFKEIPLTLSTAGLSIILGTGVRMGYQMQICVWFISTISQQEHRSHKAMYLSKLCLPCFQVERMTHIYKSFSRYHNGINTCRCRYPVPLRSSHLGFQPGNRNFTVGETHK